MIGAEDETEGIDQEQARHSTIVREGANGGATGVPQTGPRIQNHSLAKRAGTFPAFRIDPYRV
jgi:hypothetical protein